ncbi:ABC transporter substrate-binding protein [Haloferax sp. DFSO60]|uniref:ABC transporter substrate-binding protein n=1 Tax=Haloferax sp. DFSO60 TaxID=3388652 RepID=UPI00397AE1D3
MAPNAKRTSSYPSRRQLLKHVGVAGTVGLAGLAGCAGQQESGGGGGSGGGSGGGQEETGTQQEETTSESGSNDLKVGFVVPLSGPLSAPGEAEQRGAQLAVQHVNDEFGGINGRNVVGVFEDTQTDPAVGREKARKLVESDDVDVLMGAVSGAVSLSVADYAYSAGVPYYTYGGSNSITGAECKPTTFRYQFSADQDARAGAPWALDNLGQNVWIHYADYSFGQSIRDTWQSVIENTEGSNIVNVTKTPLGTSDYSSYISQMQSSNADWVLTALSGSDSINFLKQADQFGLKNQMDIMSPLNSQQPLRQGAGMAAVDTYTIIRYSYKYDTPANAELVAAYNDAYDAPPDDPGAVMWSSLRLYAQAAEKSGSTATADIVSGMADLESEEAMGPVTMRECDHQAVRDYPVGKIVAPEEYDWPALSVSEVRPADEITESCANGGCEMPSL